MVEEGGEASVDFLFEDRLEDHDAGSDAEGFTEELIGVPGVMQHVDDDHGVEVVSLEGQGATVEDDVGEVSGATIDDVGQHHVEALLVQGLSHEAFGGAQVEDSATRRQVRGQVAGLLSAAALKDLANEAAAGSE